MKKFDHILAKSFDYKVGKALTLVEHTEQVVAAVEIFADYLGMDKNIARIGAIFHDLGKVSPVFQERLHKDYKRPLQGHEPFRHELASLLFLNLVDEAIRPQVIEMIVAHHKSIFKDKRGYGIIDLEDNGYDVFELHSKNWKDWHDDALGILNYFGIKTRPISIEEAEETLEYVLEYCEEKLNHFGWSEWKGLLMGADHYASALNFETEDTLKNSFQKPKLNFYNRQHDLFPLSKVDTSIDKPHTLVTAPTGAGKTDFLIRRCKGRIFYTLPFQASINAMYERISEDLKKENPNLDLRLLHAASRIVVSNENDEQEDTLKELQGLMGASIKVLTPYQVASIVFATPGFESTLLDLKGCDIILDEIHTYSDVSKAIVLKIIEVLHHFGCRLHIGTATMPSKLYEYILGILGKENTFEYHLSNEALDKFDRHTIFKPKDFEETLPILKEALKKQQKVLIVCNRIDAAQKLYEDLTKQFEGINSMLIHSRFKRGDRSRLETELKETFNTSKEACFVVSTQVVEVSLDISFDLMITDAAPLDALVQRFGRIHRKRSEKTIGTFKPIYVLPPPEAEKSTLPYQLETVEKSYEQLPNGKVLRQQEIQAKIDVVFTEFDAPKIEQASVFKNGAFELRELTHMKKSVLLESLDIDSVSCITEEDSEVYLQADRDQRKQYEIPMRYWTVAKKGFEQLERGGRPFVIPNKSYSETKGLLKEFLEIKYYDNPVNIL